ncbi:MAG: hypothetical protein MRZ64_10770 [[Bacteroides] pectinophilus]|nr:hypothetical protein [[Bacteroides] pectinophilus]
MKKRLAVVMAAVLTLAMSVPAFAAESDSATAVKEISSVTNSDGTTTKTVENAIGTTVEVTASTSRTSTKVGDATVTTSATVATGSDIALSFTDASGKKIDRVSLTITSVAADVLTKVTSALEINGKSVSADAKNIVAAIEISATGFTGGKAVLPLKVDNVVKGEALYAIHIKNGAAEIIPAVAVQNGVVVISTSSFSPVIIVKGNAPVIEDSNNDDDDDDTPVTIASNTTTPVVTPAATTPAVVAPSTAGSTTAADASTATSPKTADAFPYVLALAAICFAGAALCIRKSSLTK